MKIIFTLIFLVLSLYYSSQGLVFDQKEYNAIPEWETNELGFSNNLPKKYSLRKYCPPVAKQDGSTCVGWATAYAGMSIMYNIQNNITDEYQKLLFAFDPLFIYTIIKENGDCDEGTYTELAIKTLSKTGCKRLFMAGKTGCVAELTDEIFSYGEPFKIKENSTKVPERENKKELIKNELVNKSPLVIAVNHSNSIDYSANGLWEVKSSSKLKSGGHAMCLVGYDDNKFGGAFEVMNSWGKEEADNGFIWIKYDDFFQVIDGVYKMGNFKNSISKKTSNKEICTLGSCLNDYSQIRYSDNSIYEGEFKDNSKDGFGIQKTENGNLFIGQWNKDRKDGNFYVFDINKKKWSKRNYKYGILSEKNEIEEEELGFTKSNTNKITEIINTIESFGLINVSGN